MTAESITLMPPQPTSSALDALGRFVQRAAEHGPSYSRGAYYRLMRPTGSLTLVQAMHDIITTHGQPLDLEPVGPFGEVISYFSVVRGKWLTASSTVIERRDPRQRHGREITLEATRFNPLGFYRREAVLTLNSCGMNVDRLDEFAARTLVRHRDTAEMNPSLAEDQNRGGIVAVAVEVAELLSAAAASEPPSAFLPLPQLRVIH